MLGLFLLRKLNRGILHITPTPGNVKAGTDFASVVVVAATEAVFVFDVVKIVVAVAVPVRVAMLLFLFLLLMNVFSCWCGCYGCCC